MTWLQYRIQRARSRHLLQVARMIPILLTILFVVPHGDDETTLLPSSSKQARTLWCS